MTPDGLEAAGWNPLAASEFNVLAGPFWMRTGAEGLELALQSEPRHSNGHLGVVHGGVLMTFVDIALGCKVAEALGEPACATVQLSFSFTAAAHIGSFLICRPELVRRTKSLVFVRGVVMADERVIGSADGIWRVLDPGKMAGLKGPQAG